MTQTQLRVPVLLLAVVSTLACATGEDAARPDRSDAAAAGAAGRGGGTAGESGHDGGMPDGEGGAPTDAAQDGLACDGEVTINELQPAGPAGPDDEFIELHNVNDCAVPLDGYSLFYRSDDGSQDHLVWSAVAGQVMQPGQFFLLGGKDFTGGSDFPMSSSVALGASGGGLGLERDGSVIDSVGWGDATNAYVEGSAAPAPDDDSSIGRFPDGKDTDDNAADFVELKPSPRKTNNAW